MRSLLDHMQQSSMASAEMYAENPEKVGAKEEGGNYVVQLIPSREALISILKNSIQQQYRKFVEQSLPAHCGSG